MTLPTLEAAIIKVRQEVLGTSMNEAEVSAGPVKRILAALGAGDLDRRARVACAAVGLELGRDVKARFNR